MASQDKPPAVHLTPVVPNLEFLMHVEAELMPPLEMGRGPLGYRRTVMLAGGTFHGINGLKGTVISGGGDWMLVDPNTQTAYLDTRYNLRTDDGALIYVQTKGVRHAEKDVLQKVLSPDADVDPKEYYFRLHVFLETGDPRYFWLNNLVIVASAIRTGKVVIYDAYKLT
ncbi:hypothetical protein M427DRAFT_130871 [Gonapodya prolifera JEL478]|uniref:Uncharacterized protein n=1 Tax=Gonapodya prolifera (strain JEL478) TaxID=1344416 RepID=A0A139AXE7_GONPJ|nr:hypothetical protein M427DRAFT_130871 [Gonapodya prolifera JEL478]|eukprot:KXS21390.1 hypothetical protein M427DRAFT_130871 [Gonapodya prolifera JEL478]